MVYLISWFVMFQSLFGVNPQIAEKNVESAAVVAIEEKAEIKADAASVYQELKENNAEALPSFDVFNYAFNGMTKIKEEQAEVKDILTVVDFSLASTEKRMWVIDLEENKILFHNLVAHGQGSGDNMATKFSNTENSHQSSIGFYLTNELYTGKHGLSLRLDGLDKGFNDNARQRAIVMHGADYVSDSFVKSRGRLGRSHGCPAIPSEITSDVVKKISKKSVMFLYYPDYFYIKQSAFLNYAQVNDNNTSAQNI